MSWSIRLGRVFGIDIYVHLTFFLLLAYIVAATYMRTRDWGLALHAVLFVSVAFLIVVMHEYGHALTARAFGVGTHDITLLPIGGIARLERMPEKPSEELAIAVAGPAVNVVLAIVFGGIAFARGEFAYGWPRDPFLDGPVALRLLILNVSLVVFNMIPAFPMDGGRVLRSVLAMMTDRVTATKAAASIGQLLALGFGFFGLMSGLPMLAFIALFVWIGAAQEANDVEQRSTLAGIPVRTAMISEYHTVTPFDTLADVARKVLATFQQDFPVVDNGSVVGMITRRDLLESLSSLGREGLVGKAMQPQFEIATPQEMLNDVIPRLQAAKSHSLPVLDQGQLVGLLTTENISELLLIRSALAQAERA